MQSYKNLQLNFENQILWVTINRPDQRNALNKETLEEIADLFHKTEGSKECRVIVIQGAGDKSFAAGADINQLYERNILETLDSPMQKVYSLIENSQKVTIAAVNGFALGGGCELALACDLRVATPNAKFGLPELNLGIIPGAGGTQRLARIIGEGRALEMILTGEIIDAETALQIGLVMEVIEKEKWKSAIKTIAEKIINKGPIAVRLAKISVLKGANVNLETGLLIEKLAQTITFATEDKKEGIQAFLEKRTANFKQK